MTRIKLCGLSRLSDIEAANGLRPDYIGFVFAPASRRYVTPEEAARLRQRLAPGIEAVGVFVRESPEAVAGLIDRGLIDVVQLHGGETEEYIRRLRALTGKPIIQAFRIGAPQDVERAQGSTADFLLFDSGSGGTGETFDWGQIRDIQRPYFLAGGLCAANAAAAVRALNPYGVDVSSGIETGGRKDKEKMAAFVRTVRHARNSERKDD